MSCPNPIQTVRREKKGLHEGLHGGRKKVPAIVQKNWRSIDGNQTFEERRNQFRLSREAGETIKIDLERRAALGKQEQLSVCRYQAGIRQMIVLLHNHSHPGAGSVLKKLHATQPAPGNAQWDLFNEQPGSPVDLDQERVCQVITALW